MQPTYKERENLLKLTILEALSRSQNALAGILEGIAGQTEEDLEVARKLRGHVEVLVRYQVSLAEKMAGIRLSRLVNGAPGKVWLDSRVRIKKP